VIVLVTTGKHVIPVLPIAVLVLADTVVMGPATMAKTAAHAQWIVAPVRTDIVGMGLATMVKTATVVLVIVDHVLHRNIVGMASVTTEKPVIPAGTAGHALHLPNIVGMAFATMGRHVIHVEIAGPVRLFAQILHWQIQIVLQPVLLTHTIVSVCKGIFIQTVVNIHSKCAVMKTRIPGAQTIWIVQIHVLL
jgi:hypothetical protein